MDKNFYATKRLAKGKAKEKTAKKQPAKDEIEAGDGVFSVKGVNVQRGEEGELMPTWVQSDIRYHINLRHGERDSVYHVTRETPPRTQYFFEGTGEDIVGVQPTRGERGRSTKKDPDTGDKVSTKKSFEELPGEVKVFIRENWKNILG